MKKNIYLFLAVFLLSLGIQAQHTLTLVADPADGGTVSGGGSYAAGAQVAVSADANVGYQFVNWTTNIPNTVTFTGAGNANYNTDFIRFGTSGGKPQWRSANNQYYIYWEPGDGWYTYTMVGGETYAYANYQDTPIPPKTGWELYDETGAVPALNYELTVSTQASFEYTMQAGNVTLTAIFEESSDPGYTLTLLADPAEGGTVSGGGDFEAGAIVPVSATAAEGYQFVNWTTGGGAGGFEVAGAGTVAANGTYVEDGELNGKPKYVKGAFEIYFQTGGWLLVDNSVGTEFLYYVMSEAPTPPQDGWLVFNGIAPAPTFTPVQGATVVSDQASFNYEMPAGDITLTANFEEMPVVIYTLTLNVDPENAGSTSGAGEYAAGSPVALSASANAGYSFFRWTNENDEVVSFLSQYIYTMPEGDVTLTANFVSLTNNPDLVVFADFEDGTHQGFNANTSNVVDNPGPGAVNSSSKALFYHAGQIWDGPNKWVAEGDHYSPEYLKMTVDVYLNEGSLFQWEWYPDAPIVVFELRGQGSISGAPNFQSPGKLVFVEEQWVRLEFDLTGMTSYDYRNFRLISSATQGWYSDNYIFYKEPSEAPELFTLTLLADPEEGGTPIGGGEYEAGTSVFIQLMVNEGYQFFKWERDGTHFSWIMNFSYTMPAEDVTLTAILNEVFALNLEVSPAGAGTVTGAGNFPAGAQRQVSATANHGFSFVNWTDELDNEVSDAPAFTYTMPANAVTLTANFQETQPVVINEFPWLEDFEPAVFPPDGWSRVNAQGAETWIRTNAPGGGFAAKHNYGSFQEDTWLITPAIEVPQAGEYELSFRHYNVYADYYPGVGGNNVMISTGSSNPADDEYTQVWSPATVLESTWENVTLSLSAYAGQTIYIAFRYYADYTHDWFVDDVKVEALPSELFTVTLLADPNDIGAVLTGEGDYETGATVTIAAENVAGYDFTGWTGLAEDVALLDDASALSTNFTMPGRNVTFTANFEEAGEPAGTSCENPYVVTLPLVDFQNTTADKGDNYSSNWINPPSFYINGNDMVLRFTVEQTGLLTGSMTASQSWIGVFIMQDCPNPDNPAIMNAWSTSSTNSLTLPSSNTNQPQEILLTPGDYFLIVSSYPPPQTIDFTLNLELAPLGDCTAPIVLTASNLTQNSADLGWTPTGSETIWNIKYGAPGFDAESEGTLVENVAANPYTLSGLDAGTTYEFYVQAVCDGGLTSDWAGPRAFTTECATAITEPFVEGFESESAPPSCWAIWYANPNPPVENLMSHSTDIAYSGSRSFRFASWTSVGGPPYEQFLRTPELDFGTNMMVSFKYSRNVMGSVGFAVGTSVNGTDWEWQDDVTDAQYLTWKTYTLYVSSDVKYVAIQYKGQFQRYLYIDDFTIERAYTVDFAVVEAGGNTHGTLTAALDGNYISSGTAVTEGSNIVFTATPDTGYRIKEWTLNGDVILVNGNPFLNPVFMYEDIAQNINVTVEFEEMPLYDLVLEVNPDNAGTVTGEGQFGEGQSVTISAIPNSGYAFVNWTDAENNIISTQASFNFTMPAQNTVLTANFSATEYELVLLPDPVVGGVLTGAGYYTVGSQVDITATANAGFEFVNWEDVDGNEISNEANFTYTMPAANILLIANFSIIPVYNLTLVADPQEGGILSGAGQYEEGATVTVTATANTNYLFINWTDANDNIISTTESFNYTMPAADVTLIANFELENSVSDIGQTVINIFPNPARDYFSIVTGEIIKKVVISDITGKIVFTETVNNIELQVNNSFEKGIYIVQIHTENGLFVRKLQIQ